MHTQIARTGFQQFQKPATRIFKMQNEILYSQIWTKKIWTFSFNETLKKSFSVYEFGLKVTDCCPGHNFPHLFLYLLLAFSFYVSVIFPLSGTSPWVTKHKGDKCFQVTSPVSGGQRERVSAVTATWSVSLSTRAEPPDLLGPSLRPLQQPRYVSSLSTIYKTYLT